MFYVSIQHGAGYHYFVYKNHDKEVASKAAQQQADRLSINWASVRYRGAQPVVRVLEETAVFHCNKPKGT